MFLCWDGTDGHITTNGTGDLTLNTNAGTNSGSVVIADGANNNVTLTANGTGKVAFASDLQINGTTNNWTIELDSDDQLRCLSTTARLRCSPYRTQAKLLPKMMSRHSVRRRKEA